LNAYGTEWIAVTLKTSTGLIPIAEDDKCILVWDFDNAPDHYKKMSYRGGDEDGVILIPCGVETPYWLETLWSNDERPTILELAEGKLIIWSHA